LVERYALLNSGSALGNNCGPLLIAKTPLNTADLSGTSIAIPGQYTTANFLLSLAFPEAQRKQELLFSDIEQAVLEERVDAGLIIHENRFTYQDKGLAKVQDLGEWWENNTGLPIPLGGIVVRRDHPVELQQRIDRVLRRSIEYAFAHPEEALPYVRAHAQEMETAVMQQHIDLYVNDYSIDLGQKGRAAVQYLFDTAIARGLLAAVEVPIFVPPSS
jgi:1,4-dihydroxy-6-naphthoate synthase